MSLFFIKRGDRLPSVSALIRGPDLQALDLTDAVGVKFICSNGVDAAATIVDPPTSGVVRYDWGANETDTAGQFDGEFEIDWGGGVKQTVPNGQDEYIKVIITADLG